MSMDSNQQTTVEGVQLVYRATADEFREGIRVLTKASPVGRRGKWIISVFGVVIAAPAVRIDSQGGSVNWVSLLFAVAFVTFGLVIAPRLQARRAHRHAEWEGERRVCVDAFGVTVTTRHTNGWSGWPAFSRYVETPRLFVLLSADPKRACVAFFPKRALPHPDGADRLRWILDQHLPRPTGKR
ncbi:YcxB family protein [Streptomyces sp. NPDC023838]|uniref:YcxB family protein n=1 Tax=Streptomyces sp. NPDC023838 TaxID=3154325 RepID=UPI00340037C7